MAGVFLIFFSIIITAADTISFKTGCRQSSTDIFFLMDSSSSIETENFANQLKFVADVVDKLNLKRKDIRVGLASFSDSFYLNIDLTDNKDSFLSDLSSVFPLSGSTRIGTALIYLKREWFDSSIARKNATKVVILITDGESVDNPVPIAEELKSQGVKIFAIKAKHVNNMGELRLIASKPTYRFILSLDARNVRDAVAKTITNIGCKTPIIRDSCQGIRNEDFRFLIDLAGFGRLKSNRIMEFTIRAINLLERKHLRAFFGIHFSSIPSQGVIKIPTVVNVTSIMERFDHSKFLGLQGIISAFTQYPTRLNLLKNKKKIIVMFVDESSEPLGKLNAAVDKFRSNDRYAAIFIVAIGTKLRTEKAKEIASDRSLYLHIPNVDEIENSYEDFVDLLCNPQDYDQSILFDDVS